MTKNILAVLLLGLLLNSCKSDDTDDSLTPINKVVNRQATGSSANDLLSDDTFTSIAIELVFVEGFEPTQTTIDNFVSFITARTFKPDGINIEKRVIPSPGQTSYTIEEIADIERKERTLYNAGKQIAIWALFLDGEADKNEGNQVVLGSAYWNTSFVIYEKTIHELSDSPFEPKRSVLETTVITHEFAHILGLTDLGSPMQTAHEDEENPKHCDVASCLMYWESEITTGPFKKSEIPVLDDQCLADLRANGGK
ncbi:membrane metalloprotease [Cognatitamlana onchidii]|uniref:membrane metalloprotease n=1 Tax=Cognatitamlana onchidii TaxID=2562860 RepID=UPI0010A6060B|nr:membrane metalloprotease [Algibacter onchidii]